MALSFLSVFKKNYFCLCWVFCFSEDFSLVLGGVLSSRGARASVAAPRLSSSGSVVWRLGLVAVQHVGSSRTRDRTVSSASAGRFFTTELPGKPSLPGFQCCV